MSCGVLIGVRLSRLARFVVAIVLAFVGIMGWSCAAAVADTPAPLAWGIFATIDPLPSPSPPAFVQGVSCPSAALCVAIDASGDVITSTDPANAWRVTTGVDTSLYQLRGISCPSGTLCVAVDGGGNVVTSTNPTGGAMAWTTKSGVVSPGFGFSGISCPTTTLCVAVTGDGNISTSTDPADGSTAVWKAVAVGPYLSGVSCASASMCVAVGSPFMGSGGVIYATTNPTTTVATNWKSTTVSSAVQGVSCPSPTLCVAFENQTSSGTTGSVISSTSPTGASPAWTMPATVDSGHTIAGLSCSSASLCIAVDNGGDALMSTNPAGGTSAWTAATVVGGNNAFSAVSCAAGPFCVATTFTTTPSQFWTTIAPTSGASAWTQANTAVPLYGLSCPSTSFCAAVDDIGNVLTSTNPDGNSPSWMVTQATGPALLSISCASASLCVATDVSGDVVTSTNPNGGTWTTTNVDGAEPIFAVSCPTASFCAAVDDAGNLLTSTNPAAGPWTVTNIDGSAFINGISCPTPSFCAAVDDGGNVLVSTDPTGGAGAWTGRAVDGANSLQAISCVATALCVAVDDAGNAITSTAPASTTPQWASTSIDNDVLNAISCPSAQMCVAVDASGYEVNSIDPAGGTNEWTYAPVLNAPIWGISCPSTVGCGVVDGLGEARRGGPTPSNLTPPTVAGAPTQGVPLTEQHGTWTDSPTSFQVRWERCNATGAACDDISNATAQQYIPVAADVGSTIRVLELATNINGDGVTVESAPTTPVAAAPVLPPKTAPANTKPPVLSGSAQVGLRLSASTGTWSGTAPISFGDQWQRCSTSVCTNIAGATSNSYTPTGSDLGLKIRVVVSASNRAGSAQAASIEVGPVLASVAQIKALLTSEITPRGRAAKIAAILKTGGYLLTFKAPEAGTAAIRWYVVPEGAHLASAKPVLIATGRLSFTKTGTGKLNVTLTAAGKKLLEEVHDAEAHCEGLVPPDHRLDRHDNQDIHAQTLTPGAAGVRRCDCRQGGVSGRTSGPRPTNVAPFPNRQAAGL